jgi:hypothetical protein
MSFREKLDTKQAGDEGHCSLVGLNYLTANFLLLLKLVAFAFLG